MREAVHYQKGRKLYLLKDPDYKRCLYIQPCLKRIDQGSLLFL